MIQNIDKKTYLTRNTLEKPFLATCSRFSMTISIYFTSSMSNTTKIFFCIRKHSDVHIYSYYQNLILKQNSDKSNFIYHITISIHSNEDLVINAPKPTKPYLQKNIYRSDGYTLPKRLTESMKNTKGRLVKYNGAQNTPSYPYAIYRML